MKRALLLNCAALVFLPCATFGQATGQLVVTVKAASEANLAAAPANGVKVIIVHWTNIGLHPTLTQDQMATTDQMGRCTVQLPRGTYDVFISANGLSPSAFRREVKPGESTSITTTLRPSALQLRPAQ
jgi:hypothetical protein